MNAFAALKRFNYPHQQSHLLWLTNRKPVHDLGDKKIKSARPHKHHRFMSKMLQRNISRPFFFFYRELQSDIHNLIKILRSPQKEKTKMIVNTE